MKRISNEYYIVGIESRNRFMEMLQNALKKSLNGVELRQETSFSWQGYKIKKYLGLKENQYYCMFYSDSPNILTFHEYYEMFPHPFQIEVDLASHGFYQLSYALQFQFLVDFINSASTEAKKWNASQKRRDIVPEKFW